MIINLLIIIHAAEIELILKRTSSVTIIYVCLRLILIRTSYVAMIKIISQLFKYNRIISQSSIRQSELSREGFILPAARCDENSASVLTRVEIAPPFFLNSIWLRCKQLLTPDITRRYEFIVSLLRERCSALRARGGRSRNIIMRIKDVSSNYLNFFK